MMLMVPPPPQSVRIYPPVWWNPVQQTIPIIFPTPTGCCLAHISPETTPVRAHHHSLPAEQERQLKSLHRNLFTQPSGGLYWVLVASVPVEMGNPVAPQDQQGVKDQVQI